MSLNAALMLWKNVVATNDLQENVHYFVFAGKIVGIQSYEL